MKITDFEIYKDLVKEKSGLVLTHDKSYLLESRLKPVAKKWGYPSLEAMTMVLHGVPDPKLINDIIEAMTTNETSFFRDIHPFETFKSDVMNYMKKARGKKRKLRIWCNAASSGQEPYSLAIALKEMAAELPSWKFEILATDISDEVLSQAHEGAYSQFEIQRGMPVQLMIKYFRQHDNRWHLDPDVKKMVKFETFNLLEPMYSLGYFDIIFCRNVLIYFDTETKAHVLNNMSKLLEPDGFLFLGGAETVIGITEAFKPVPEKRGLYALESSAHVKGSSTTQALA